MRGISERSRIRFLGAWRPVAVVILSVLLGACSGESDSLVPGTEVDFRFGMHGDDDGSDDFVARTSDVDIISVARSQLALPDSERALHINGPIERGNGGHNLDWGWHFTPSAWTLAGVSIEVCDGGPQAVEDDLDYWVDTVQSFCPWSSYVKEEVGQTQRAE